MPNPTEKEQSKQPPKESINDPAILEDEEPPVEEPSKEDEEVHGGGLNDEEITDPSEDEESEEKEPEEKEQGRKRKTAPGGYKPTKKVTRAAAAAAKAAAAKAAAERAAAANRSRVHEEDDFSIQPRTQNATAMAMVVKQLQILQDRMDEKFGASKDKEALIASNKAAQARGGIYGYNNGKPLTRREEDLFEVYESFCNEATAEELFRSDLSTIDSIRRLTPERASRFSRNLASYRHPTCPDPTAVYISDSLIEKLMVFAEWVRYQPLIGARPTAKEWLEQHDSYERTEKRLVATKKQREATPVTTPPPSLTTLPKFAEWDRAFRQDLRDRFNKHGFPLLYVIRPDDEAEVTEEDRSSPIGGKDGFSNWTEYNLRCAVLEGEQFEEDNQTVWTLLCAAVRSGPGWEYIRTFAYQRDETRGNARAAYLHIYDHAFTETNVDAIVSKTVKAIADSKYSGDSRHNDFETHCRNWLKFRTTLINYGGFDPKRDEKRFILDFFRSVTDERLNNAKSIALRDKKKYMWNFRELIAMFTEELGITTIHHSNKRGRSVSAFVASGGGNGSGNGNKKSKSVVGTYTGMIEAKNYPLSVYRTFSAEQREKLKELRRKKAQSRSVQATETQPAQPPQASGAGNSFGPKGRKKGKNGKGKGNGKKD